MQKYLPLGEHLSKVRDTAVSLTFEEINHILRPEKLPDSAYKRRSWWGNDRSHVQARSWLEANWKVNTVELKEKLVSFNRS